MAGTTSGVLVNQNGDDIDIAFFQGKTINFSVTWGGANPINITGFTAKLQARREFSGDVVAEFSVANGRVNIGGSNGIITFTMNATDSAALPVCVGVYDVELSSPIGAVYQVMSGKFKVLAEVTR